ncbi:hypothetical protein [Streptomyces sp. NBC_01235]|uniref:hypothetical protein n=1 Tax=Streptomyces sp. NBC_01235 TaxID=2903788 RepID=UPI002E144223|nr:hypothetical protein OG289_34660 [Streptomyces sp. NBC_01235]
MQRIEHVTKYQGVDRIDFHLQVTHVVVTVGSQAHEEGETAPDGSALGVGGLLRPEVTAAEKRPPDGARR